MTIEKKPAPGILFSIFAKPFARVLSNTDTRIRFVLDGEELFIKVSDYSITDDLWTMEMRKKT